MKPHFQPESIFARVLPRFLMTAISCASFCVSASEILVKPGDDYIAKIESAAPGDIVTFTPGTYAVNRDTWYSDRYIDVKGTESNPVLIRSQLPRQAVIDGNDTDSALRFRNASNVIIDGFTITNPDPDGIDGRRQITAIDKTTEGISLSGTYSNVIIRNNFFKKIGDRGVLTGCDKPDGAENVSIASNLFSDVGHDDASGDINPTCGKKYSIRFNYFAGSVDGVVFAGFTQGGHLVEKNIFIGSRAEDGVDLKGVNVDGSGDWTMVTGNVIYAGGNGFTGITIQDESNKIRVENNYIDGGGVTAPNKLIHIHGRSAGTYTGDGVRDHEILNNYLYNSTKIGILAGPAADIDAANKPVPLVNIVLKNNYFDQIADKAELISSIESSVIETAVTEQEKTHVSELGPSILGELCKNFSQEEIREAANNSRAAVNKIDVYGASWTCPIPSTELRAVQ